jgi:hypothetical protein
VERVRIREAIDAYAAAAVDAARSPSGPARVDALERMKARREYLQRVRTHPDGAGYVGEILGDVLEDHALRAEELREQERRLLELSPPPPGLNLLVAERYDREVMVEALKKLR